MFGRYRYKWLSFGAAPVGDMFQRKIDETSKDLPNVFCIADDISVVKYENNGTDYEKNLCRVLKICRKENLKLIRDKWYFWCT